MSRRKDIYRRNFCPLGKRLMLELFETHTSAISGIVLQKTGLPAGAQTLYLWWLTDDSAGFQKGAHDLRTGAENFTPSVERSRGEFEDLLTQIKQTDHPQLPDFPGTKRDGQVFAVAWGSPQTFRHLSISNLDPGSRHAELVSVLEARAWT